MKECTKCGNRKMLDDFPKAKSARDGRGSWCRACQREYVRAWKSAHPERVRKSNRQSDRKRYWDNPDAGRARGRAKYHANAEAWKARAKAASAEQHRAHWRIRELTRSGRLVRPDACPICGRSDLRIEAHHPDHAKPEVVEFMCSACHGLTRRIG
jgi:hypothetical protein